MKIADRPGRPVDEEALVVDPVSNYVQLVSGLSKATRARARGVARSLLAQAGLDDVAADASDRITRLAEEIMATSRANRDLLEKLVTTEVDKAADRLGFVRAEDLDALRAEVAVIKTMINLQTPSAPAKKAPATKAPAKKAPATKATATKAPAKKTTAQKTTAKKATAKKAPARKATAKKAPAKKTAAAEPAVSNAEDQE